ncbi:hypothetical protein BDV98DRAFT_177722 [Pterulicium gracile]|uniref:Uncharacterized protein n=1 Tax=Pterulicium gracile TaxID=1884261 RepID=A0A5C3QBE8_9AGAR|nr:hypothetical protein BDV98DRAFT_177722 [Pterula gracilis]
MCKLNSCPDANPETQASFSEAIIPLVTTALAQPTLLHQIPGHSALCAGALAEALYFITLEGRVKIGVKDLARNRPELIDAIFLFLFAASTEDELLSSRGDCQSVTAPLTPTPRTLRANCTTAGPGPTEAPRSSATSKIYSSCSSTSQDDISARIRMLRCNETSGTS